MAGILVEDGFDVHNRRAVHSLEVSDTNPKSVHTNDLGPMEPDRVWTMRAPRGEHAFLWSRRIAARVHAQDGAIGEVKPREDENLVTDAQVPCSFADVGVEDEPGLGRSLVGLARRVIWVEQGRFYVTD